MKLIGEVRTILGSLRGTEEIRRTLSGTFVRWHGTDIGEATYTVDVVEPPVLE